MILHNPTERTVHMDATSGSASSLFAPITPDKSKSMPQSTQHEHVSLDGAVRDEEHKKLTSTPQSFATANADRSPARPEAPIKPDNGEGIPHLFTRKEGSLSYAGALHMHSTPASAQQLDDEKDATKKNRTMSSNRTIGQKPMGRKHRSKVIREGEKMKTLKPSMLQTEETPVETAKRSNVRENRGIGSDSPCTTAGPQVTHGARSVKGKLEFESEGVPTSTMTEAKFSGEEELKAPACYKTNSTVLLGQGQKVGVENSPARAMLDLNH